MATDIHRDPVLIAGYRSCFTSDGRPKRRYRTWLEAERVAWKLERQDGVAMRAYRCPVCRDWWHVGHRREWE